MGVPVAMVMVCHKKTAGEGEREREREGGRDIIAFDMKWR